MAVRSEVKEPRAGGPVSRGEGVRNATIVIAASASLLLAFALRVFRLDGQSLWYDEGVSAAMAVRDFGEITARAAGDIHPPLYYYLLHVWSGLAGNAEFALRFLSLAEGVILVAVVFAIGRRLFNRSAGLVAACFAAFSPFLIYYSQEARMYSQVTLLAAASTLLAARLLPALFGDFDGRMSRLLPLWIGYTMMGAAMLYSHYFSFSVLLAHNVIALGLLLGRRSLGQRLFLRVASWAAAQAVVVGAYLPWLLATYRQLQSWPTISEPFTLGTLLDRLFMVFSFGLSSDAAATPNRELVFVALLCAALLIPLARYRAPRLGPAVIVLHLAAPVLVIFVLSLQRPMYNPKFLLLAVPAYLVLLAVGFESLRQTFVRISGHLPKFVAPLLSATLAIACLAAVAYPSAFSLNAYYFDPKYSRDDYRGLVGFLSARLAPDDAIVLNAPGQQEIFAYYYKGAAAVYPLPLQRPIDEAQTTRALEDIAARHSRVWLVLWATAESDPSSFVEHWLDEHRFKTDNRWFGNLRLCTYAGPGADAEGVTEQTAVNFQNLLRLTALRFDSRVLAPGDAASLTLNWETDRVLDSRYTVFVHVVDDRDFLWGQMDSEPAGASRPTTTWMPGVPVVDRRGIPLLPGTPPGEYNLELGVYRPDSGQRLTIVGPDGRPAGDRYLFGPIRVTRALSPPPLESLALAGPSASFARRLALLGARLNPLGRDGAGPVFAPNDIAHLTLLWRSETPSPAVISGRLLARDQAGQAVLDREQRISARYPTSDWAAGEIVRDQYKLPLEGLPSGDYGLSIGLRDDQAALLPASGGTEVALGRFRIR